MANRNLFPNNCLYPPKDNMEHSNRIKKEQIFSICFLVLLFLAIISLIFAIIVVYKNVDALRNPLHENLENLGLDSCSCVDSSGLIFSINKSGDFKQEVNDVPR